MPGAEVNFDREEAFRRLRQMAPQELAAVLAHLESIQGRAGEGEVPHGYGQGTVTWRGTATEYAPPDPVVAQPEGIPSQSAVGDVNVTVGTATIALSEITATVSTSWNVEAAPGASQAVASLWELIKPKSTEDLVAIARELRLWICALVVVLGVGAATPNVLSALEEAFTAGASVAERSVAEDAEPPADKAEE